MSKASVVTKVLTEAAGIKFRKAGKMLGDASSPNDLVATHVPCSSGVCTIYIFNNSGEPSSAEIWVKKDAYRYVQDKGDSFDEFLNKIKSIKLPIDVDGLEKEGWEKDSKG